tara:strand:+ start:1212 stop:1415 length:204 start_codon:yes stop_codon:yes gene_type:complete
MGCLFSFFTDTSENYQKNNNVLEPIKEDDDLEINKENDYSDNYYDELNRPYFFNSLAYYRAGYYTTD